MDAIQHRTEGRTLPYPTSVGPPKAKGLCALSSPPIDRWEQTDAAAAMTMHATVVAMRIRPSIDFGNLLTGGRGLRAARPSRMIVRQGRQRRTL